MMRFILLLSLAAVAFADKRSEALDLFRQARPDRAATDIPATTAGILARLDAQTRQALRGANLDVDDFADKMKGVKFHRFIFRAFNNHTCAEIADMVFPPGATAGTDGWKLSDLGLTADCCQGLRQFFSEHGILRALAEKGDVEAADQAAVQLRPFDPHRAKVAFERLDCDIIAKVDQCADPPEYAKKLFAVFKIQTFKNLPLAFRHYYKSKECCQALKTIYQHAVPGVKNLTLDNGAPSEENLEKVCARRDDIRDVYQKFKSKCVPLFAKPRPADKEKPAAGEDGRPPARADTADAVPVLENGEADIAGAVKVYAIDPATASSIAETVGFACEKDEDDNTKYCWRRIHAALKRLKERREGANANATDDSSFIERDHTDIRRWVCSDCAKRLLRRAKALGEKAAPLGIDLAKPKAFIQDLARLHAAFCTGDDCIQKVGRVVKKFRENDGTNKDQFIADNQADVNALKNPDTTPANRANAIESLADATQDLRKTVCTNEIRSCAARLDKGLKVVKDRVDEEKADFVRDRVGKAAAGLLQALPEDAEVPDTEDLLEEVRSTAEGMEKACRKVAGAIKRRRRRFKRKLRNIRWDFFCKYRDEIRESLRQDEAEALGEDPVNVGIIFFKNSGGADRVCPQDAALGPNDPITDPNLPAEIPADARVDGTASPAPGAGHARRLLNADGAIEYEVQANTAEDGSSDDAPVQESENNSLNDFMATAEASGLPAYEDPNDTVGSEFDTFVGVEGGDSGDDPAQTGTPGEDSATSMSTLVAFLATTALAFAA